MSSAGHWPKKVEDTNSAKNKKTIRHRIWNMASIVFGGVAIAYGISTEEHFTTAAGSTIAAIGIASTASATYSFMLAQVAKFHCKLRATDLKYQLGLA